MSSPREFFAATKSGSVYRVYIADDSDAVMEKIAQATTQSGGLDIGTRLQGGYHVGVTNWGLTKYSASFRDGMPMQAGKSNHRQWGGQTSCIAALFLDKAKALECVEADELQPWDARWTAVTKETLEAIRGMNPLIVLDDDIPLVRK